MRSLVIYLLCTNTCFAASASNGIHVDSPEVYDNSFLQAQLNVIQSQLLALRTIDQASLMSHIGSLQGANLQQSSLSVQAVGSPLPQVTTTVPVNGSPASTSNTQVTQQAAVTPNIPAISPSSLSLPSAISPSALDTLNEQLQLSSQIINYELLLGGSYFDKFTKAGVAKRQLTIGFPITIEPPPKEYKNHIAEVEITYCFKASADTEPLSIINLLPKENTYNVMSLTDKSKSFGLGAIVGVFSVNAGFLSATKSAYLVKQQDTVSYKRGEDSDKRCGDGYRGIVFAWQFRPVLGEQFVRSGTRMTFVQLAVPYTDDQGNSLQRSASNQFWSPILSSVTALMAKSPSPIKTSENSPDNATTNRGKTDTLSGEVIVRTSWRCLDPESGAVAVADPKSIVEEKKFDKYEKRAVLGVADLAPEIEKIEVSDLGNGSVLAIVNGRRIDGPKVRIGSTIVDLSAGPKTKSNTFEFSATAQLLASTGAYAITSSGVEVPIVSANLPNEKFTIRKISVSPASESTSVIELRLTNTPGLIAPASTHTPLIVITGGKAFGLSDSPFSYADYAGNVLRFEIANDSLKSAPLLRVQRLFGKPENSSDWFNVINPGAIELTKIKADPKSATKPRDILYFVSGSLMDEMTVVTPTGWPDKCTPTLEPQTATLKIMHVPICAETQKSNLKYLLFTDKTGTQEVAVSLPVEKAVPTTPPPPASATAPAGPTTGSSKPNFTMVRAVENISEADGVAFLTVWIKGLKDQSATLTVAGADVSTVVDSTGKALIATSPNSISVSQNTALTFQLRNSSPTIKVTAEGKNGSSSTGKLAYTFSIVKDFRKKPTS